MDARAGRKSRHHRGLRQLPRGANSSTNAFTLHREHGRFVSPDTLRLSGSGTELTADFFVIATGSVPWFPDVPGLDDPHVWTSDDVLDLAYLPESVIVLGGGVVACELAQYLRRIGSRVTMIQRSPRILREVCHKASDVVQEAFGDEGIELYTDTTLRRVERTGLGFRVHFRHIAHETSVEAAHVLCTLGRVPNTAPLGLEAAGVELRSSGHIRVDAMQRTSNPRIYAAGDVCGPVEIVHLAIMQGEVAANHGTGGEPAPVDYDLATRVYFTDPQVARWASTSASSSARHRLQGGILPLQRSRQVHPHERQPRLRARLRTRVRWPLLGAECVGKDAGESSTRWPSPWPSRHAAATC
jgi:pyruvate/2-oxoglutarate dehydrogenase complex dihydrolipoamide dehydrogenase (E3) component